eukprot:2803711-Rhodomonas_salina.2
MIRVEDLGLRFWSWVGDLEPWGSAFRVQGCGSQVPCLARNTVLYVSELVLRLACPRFSLVRFRGAVSECRAEEEKIHEIGGHDRGLGSTTT